MISTQVHTRGFLSILLTSQQIPTLQIKSNCSFCEEPGHGACSQYSSQSRVSSELTWSQTPQSELQFPPRDTQPRFQSLHSRWVLIFFFSSQGLNRTSPCIGTGIQRCPVFIITEQTAISETFSTLCNLQLYWQPQKHPKNPTSTHPDITDFSEQRSVFSVTFLLSAHPSASQPQADVHREKNNLILSYKEPLLQSQNITP